MFSNIIKRLKNGRLATFGAFFFAALMTFSLCGLNAASEAEIRKYEDAYNSLPVTMTVTSLTGIRDDGLELPSWVVNVFTDPPMNTLTKDLEVKMTMRNVQNVLGGYGFENDKTISGNVYLSQNLYFERLVGITSPELEDDLDKDLTFYEGYDASILKTEADNTYVSGSGGDQREELYIIVPREVYEKGCYIVTMDFFYDDPFDSYPIARVTRTFTVVGSHAMGEGIFYCPYNTLVRIMKDIGMPRYADSVRATVAKNEWLDKVKARVAEWFVEPSLTAERVPWNYSYYFYYPFALDIDESALIRAGEVMQTNIMINKIGTVLVFALSAGAGFLIGFLIVNRRKREIMLMRTMGMPDRTIFRDFFLEQGLCALAGALFGGIFFLWQPIARIGLFLVLNFAGLALSLIIFLKKNLLTAIKED